LNAASLLLRDRALGASGCLRQGRGGSTLVLGYWYGYFDGRDLIRIGAWLTVVEFLILLLLVPFYWPLIGIY
jgi:di/tricarboxylate transporter